jgi:hypothetical protein
VITTDVEKIIEAFPGVEEREFLFEMVEPEMFESKEVLNHHNQEELTDIEDLESWTNMMGRQKRRVEFITKLHVYLGGSLPDD